MGFAERWDLVAANTFNQSSSLPDQRRAHKHHSTKALSKLDYVFASKSFQFASGVLGEWAFPSDHLPVVVQLESPSQDFRRRLPRFSSKGWQPTTEQGREEFKEMACRTMAVDPSGRCPSPTSQIQGAIAQFANQVSHSTYMMRAKTAKEMPHHISQAKREWKAATGTYRGEETCLEGLPEGAKGSGERSSRRRRQRRRPRATMVPHRST